MIRYGLRVERGEVGYADLLFLVGWSEKMVTCEMRVGFFAFSLRDFDSIPFDS